MEYKNAHFCRSFSVVHRTNLLMLYQYFITDIVVIYCTLLRKLSPADSVVQFFFFVFFS